MLLKLLNKYGLIAFGASVGVYFCFLLTMIYTLESYKNTIKEDCLTRKGILILNQDTHDYICIQPIILKEYHATSI
jgi:hypothetical protein